MPTETKKDKSKYWIQHGTEVIHKPTGQKMTVYFIDIERQKMKDATYRTTMNGVNCKWVDPLGRDVTGKFHTKDLAPAP